MLEETEVESPRPDREQLLNGLSPLLPESEATTVHAPPPKSQLREYFEMLVVTMIQLLFLWTFIAQGMRVPTGSMQNTINIGDNFFANKFIFGRQTPLLGALLPAREIERGDVIIFKYPLDPKTNYVKRVIGLPGDEIELRGLKVFINGRELPEQRVTINQAGSEFAALPELNTENAPPEAKYKVYYEERTPDVSRYEEEHPRYGSSEPLRVPPGHYFVMGDNRDNSQDSRFWGCVPRDHIIGRALYVHWSFNSGETETLQSGNWLTDLLRRPQWNRIGQAIK